MTGKQKLMMACFVIGLFFVGLSISAFSADYGKGGPLYPLNYQKYLNRLLVGVGFWVLGFLSFVVQLVIQKVRDKRRKP